jgi:NitT/TauT family transport system substrate-binding protein
VTGVVLLGAIAGSACAWPADDETRHRTIRVAFAGTPDFGDLPGVLAHERLRAEGYAVEETYYNGTDIAIDALARGAADFGGGSITGAWTAAVQGRPLRTVMEQVANPHRLVVVRSVEACRALGQRRLAVNGEAAVGTDLIRIYLAEECPGVKPAVLYINGSDSRAAALLAGTIDAAAIDLGILHWLEEQAPGRFKVLVDFAHRWPSIKTTGVQVNTDFAAAHRDVVVDYLRARLSAVRDLTSSPDLLAAQAARVFGPAERWPRVARTYIEEHSWAADGGLTETDVERTLAFFANDTLRRASPRDVSDLSFLREALSSLPPVERAE